MTNEKVILIYTIITGLWNIINIFQLDSKMSRQMGGVLSTSEYVLPAINHLVRALVVIYAPRLMVGLSITKLAYIVSLILLSIFIGTLAEMIIRLLITKKGDENEQPNN